MRLVSTHSQSVVCATQMSDTYIILPALQRGLQQCGINVVKNPISLYLLCELHDIIRVLTRLLSLVN